MLYYDHAMLGITVALAAGVHRRHGWPLIVTAGVAAMLPDWDGLSKLAGPEAYREVHRTWGHNLLAAPLASGLFAGAAYLCYVSGGGRPTARAGHERPRAGPTFSGHALGVWVAVGVLVALSHVLADLVYCGRRLSPDWPVALLWPFSPRRWGYPLVPWSDLGVTLLLVGEMLALCVCASRARLLACATLLAVFGYVGVRGLWAE